MSAPRDLCARRINRPPADARLQTLTRRARERLDGVFKVNSSNRFSAGAEVAHVTAGHVLPWQREARFRSAIVEQFVLSTRPAADFAIPTHLIVHTRARLVGVVAASVARY